MNAKKWVTIVTLICTIIAVVLMTVFKCCFSDGNIGYDIALRSQGNCVKQGKTFLKELSANT